MFAYPKYCYQALLTWNAINSGVNSLTNINVDPCILFACPRQAGFNWPNNMLATPRLRNLITF